MENVKSLTSQNPATQVIKDRFANFLFIVPAMALFSVFYLVPFIQILQLSFQGWNGISPEKTFAGLDNFKDLLSDCSWWRSIGNACYITGIALTFQNCLAFALALACDRQIRLKRFYRLVFFLPPVLSEIVVGFLWKWILNADIQNGQHVGLLNSFLERAGFAAFIHNWLSDPHTALTCIAVVHSWKGFGWGFIMLLAGLQTIDRRLYEAAQVDGAGPLKIFWHITVPLMLPVIAVVVILTILGSMQSFALILAMMGHGLGDHTSVPVTEILSSMTRTDRFGYACAQGVALGLILVSVSFAMKYFIGRVKRF